MQISITNTFKISVGDHEIILSMSDAEKLYQELGRALGKNLTNITLFRGSQLGTPETTPIPFRTRPDPDDLSIQKCRMENKS